MGLIPYKDDGSEQSADDIDGGSASSSDSDADENHAYDDELKNRVGVLFMIHWKTLKCLSTSTHISLLTTTTCSSRARARRKKRRLPRITML